MSFLVPPRRPSREILDDSNLSPQELKRFFEDLDLVNRAWGNARALARWLLPGMLASDTSPWVILDVGAGAATMSQDLVARLRRVRTPVSSVALDLKWHHLVVGRTRFGRNAPAGVAADAFRLPFPDGSVDWVVSTLFFHHFSPAENLRLLREFARIAKKGFALLDIRRSFFPLFFLSVLGPIVLRSRFALEDGVTSVRQAYTATEARAIAAEALPGARVERVFPFRLMISTTTRPPSPSSQTLDSRPSTLDSP
jgi:ubiquinone/menaquinone biosynthesis C-methylase UbiE